jgi:hypothetical protein
MFLESKKSKALWNIANKPLYGLILAPEIQTFLGIIKEFARIDKRF